MAARARPGPLAGRLVLVTRDRRRAPPMVALLEERGARAVLAPAIEVTPAPPSRLDEAVRQLAAGAFSWVVLTSRAGVAALLDRAAELGVPPERMRAEVAAVGEGTAAELRQRGVEPALVPATYTTFALSRAFPRGAGRVLLARADIAPDDLEAAIAHKGWTPVRVDSYTTRLARSLPAPAERALRSGDVDAVTFTSASTVRGFLGVGSEALAAAPRRPKVVAIGPVTSRAAREAGLAVDRVASPHTIEGVVRAVERVLSQRGSRREAR